jgi:hypothetical protein
VLFQFSSTSGLSAEKRTVKAERAEQQSGPQFSLIAGGERFPAPKSVLLEKLSLFLEDPSRLEAGEHRMRMDARPEAFAAFLRFVEGGSGQIVSVFGLFGIGGISQSSEISRCLLLGKGCLGDNQEGPRYLRRRTGAIHLRCMSWLPIKAFRPLKSNYAVSLDEGVQSTSGANGGCRCRCEGWARAVPSINTLSDVI